LRLLAQLTSLVRRAIHCRELDNDLDEELRSQLALMTDEKIKQGMEPDQARRAAKIELGGVEQVKEQVRAVRTGAWMDSLVQDIRLALRVLRKNPGFTAVVVLTLALGIGANTAIFTVAYDVLLRPLPYRNAGKLVMVWEDDSLYGFPENTPSPGNYSAWKAQNHVFTDMAAYNSGSFNLTGHGNPEALWGVQVTANMFPLLGVKPELGDVV
jgi:hypothetical protein